MSVALSSLDSRIEFLPAGRVLDRKLLDFVLRVFTERLCLVDRLLHPKHFLRVSGDHWSSGRPKAARSKRERAAKDEK
jgi:hypothetical protein